MVLNCGLGVDSGAVAWFREVPVEQGEKAVCEERSFLLVARRRRHERRAVAISSNLHPSGFDELMPRTIATALVDRLLHHAHVIVTTGDSVRLAQATTGKGVKPLGR